MSKRTEKEYLFDIVVASKRIKNIQLIYTTKSLQKM